MPKSLVYVKVINLYRQRKDVTHKKINKQETSLRYALRSESMLEQQTNTPKAMHAEYKAKKRIEMKHTHMYIQGAKQESRRKKSPRPYPRHYPSLQSSSTSLTTHTLRFIPVQGELGDTYGGANMPTQIKRRPSGPAWHGHLT